MLLVTGALLSGVHRTVVKHEMPSEPCKGETVEPKRFTSCRSSALLFKLCLEVREIGDFICWWKPRVK